MCHHVDMKSKKSERIGDTVDFLPRHTKMAFMSSDDRASLAATYLTEALLHPNTEASVSYIGETQETVLRQICNPASRLHGKIWCTPKGGT